MTSRSAFDAFAVARGEGLHPKLRELFDRAAARPFAELMVRGDGMLQAGPDPASDALAGPSNVTSGVTDKAMSSDLEARIGVRKRTLRRMV